MKSIIVFLVSFHISTSIHAQWIPTGGPIGNLVIEDIFRYYDNDYISVKDCGLFKRGIAEDAWTFLSEDWFTDHQIIGDSIFVNVKGDEVLSIELDGQEVKYNRKLFGNDFKTVLHYHDSKLYISSSRNIYRYSIDGSEIERLTEGIPLGQFDDPAPIFWFAISDKSMICTTVYGVQKSDIDNVNWKLSNEGIEPGFIDILEENEGNYFCSQNEKLYRSTNDGDNWSIIYSAPSNINDLHFSSDTIFIGTGANGIQISTDLGDTWSNHLLDGSDISIKEIVNLENNMYYTHPTEGLFEIKNKISSADNFSLDCSTISTLISMEDNFYAAGPNFVGFQNNISAWDNRSPDIPSSGFGKLNIIGDTLIVAVSESISVPPFRLKYFIYSIDQGEIWNKMINPIPIELSNLSRVTAFKNRLYVWDTDQAYYTSNLGEDWIGFILPDEFCNSYVDGMFVHNSDLYIKTCTTGQLLKMDDNGEFIDITKTLPQVNISNVLFNENYILLQSSFGLYRSKIEEDNWEEIIGGSDNVSRIKASVTIGSTIYVATINGAFYTNDNGDTWIDHNQGLPARDCQSLTLHNDSLYIGTGGNGVFKRHIDPKELISNSVNTIDSYKEIILYPNPTSDILNIDIDGELDADLRLFDLAGKEISFTNLDSGTIDVSHLFSGIYFLNFTTMDNSITKVFVIHR